MSISQNYPNIVPSLNLDFARVKALDPRVTFARASSATYYGTETAKAEENLLLYSQALATSPWTQIRATRTNNAATAPDGTNTATAITQATSETIAGGANQSNTVIAADYVMSVSAKPNGKNFLRFSETFSDGTTKVAWFDVSTGTIGTVSAGLTATIVAEENGFYRCILAFTVNASRSGSFGVQVADTDGSNTVTDSGGIYAWGAQLEQRDAVTAYTPTTDQPITRYQPVLESEPAGVARFDHDPVTGESLGLLVEEQRTNLLVRSEEFDNAGWSKSNATITANTIVAPDGTLTGDKLVENTDNSSHLCTQLTALTANAVYTLSVYAKAGGRPRIQVQTASVSNWSSQVVTTFDLVTGTVADGTGIITPVGNGWYRCSITATFGTSNATGGLNIFTIQGGSVNQVYQGDGFSGIYIWGAQLEAGAFPTSYIKTVASQVTRSADSASMTGANFSSWYRQDEGTVYLEASTPSENLTFFSEYLAISDGTESNRHLITQPSSTIAVRAITRTNGTQVSSLQPLTAIINQPFKFVYAYKTNDFAAVGSDGSALVDNSGNLPVVNKIGISQSSTGAIRTRYIRKLSFYPQRLTNAQLQALTG